MAKGDGTIHEELDKNGKSFRPKRWRVVVPFGRNKVTGRYERLTRIVRGTKADAMRERDKMQEERNGGISPTTSGSTFAEFADAWLTRRAEAEEATRSRIVRETHLVEDMKHYIGDVALRDLGPLDIENFYARLRCDRIDEKGKFSSTTMNMYHKVLKQILKQAVDYDVILRNPADKVKAPRIAEVNRRSLSEGELQHFYDYLGLREELAYEQRLEIERRQEKRGDFQHHSYLRSLSTIGNIIGVRIGIATGMRRGEVMGLTWGNVDFSGGTITVSDSITVYGERKGPKSRAGRRVIAIDSETARHLETWKEFQKVELARIHAIQTNLTPVCCNDMGEVMNPNNFSRWWRAFVVDAGLEGLKFHELRHTQATQLIASGVDIKTVQNRLGHASATLTMNQYAHALPENDRAASEILGKILSPGSNDSEPGKHQSSSHVQGETANDSHVIRTRGA